MRSTTLITAATALFSSALASPVNSGSKATRSTAGFKSFEAHPESTNAVSDQVAVRLDRRQSSNDNTGKLVPIAQLTDHIEKGINGMTDLILKIECPQSLSPDDFARCAAAQEGPLQRLRDWYPDSIDWNGYDNHGPPNQGPPHGPLNQGPPHGPPNVPTITVTTIETIEPTTSESPTTITVTATETIQPTTSESPTTITVTATETISPTTATSTDVSTTSTLTLTSTLTSASTVAVIVSAASDTVSQSTATLAITTTSSNNIYTTFTANSTAEVDVTQTMDLTPVPATEEPPSSSPTLSSNNNFTSAYTRYRTVYQPTTSRPYWFGTLTPPVPAAPQTTAMIDGSSVVEYQTDDPSGTFNLTATVTAYAM